MKTDAFKSVLVAADKKLTLVGSQAVAIWASQFGEPLKFVGRDIQFWGDRDSLQKLAEALHGEANFCHFGFMSPIIGSVQLLDSRCVLVLHCVPGIDVSDPAKTTLL